jgi:putative ABC transport system ATP-binding protein
VPPVFSFEDVVVRYGGEPVLDSVTFAVAERRITVLTGPSGSGKTTLLRLCNRLEVPTSGRLLYRGRDVAELDPLAHRRRVGMVFQRPTLFAGTVRENLAVARRADDDVYTTVLARVGLAPSYLDNEGDTLSGGEAQRACLARTLMTDPEVLLMDEPTSSLDRAAAEVLEELAVGMARDGLTVLWVSHDLEQVRRIADEVTVLLGGRVVAGEPAERYLAR